MVPKDKRTTVDVLRQRVERLEKEMLALRQELECAHDRASVALVARGIAHDMNNILASIMGLASILKMDHDLRDSVKKDLEAIVSACIRARELMMDLRNLAQDAHQILHSLSLREIVDEAVLSIRKKGHPAGSSMDCKESVEIIVDHTCQNDSIVGDSTQLKQILLHLYRNAAVAMGGSGNVHFSTSNVQLSKRDLIGYPKLEPGDYVRLIVSDEGCGMDSATLKKACRPFFTTQDFPGAGLGLAYVLGAVKNHQGRLEIESTPHVGTTVIIDLPNSPLLPRADW